MVFVCGRILLNGAYDPMVTACSFVTITGESTADDWNYLMAPGLAPQHLRALEAVSSAVCYKVRVGAVQCQVHTPAKVYQTQALPCNHRVNGN